MKKRLFFNFSPSSASFLNSPKSNKFLLFSSKSSNLVFSKFEIESFILLICSFLSLGKNASKKLYIFFKESKEAFICCIFSENVNIKLSKLFSCISLFSKGIK